MKKAPSSKSTPDRGAAPSETGTILVVDDDPRAVDIICKLLSLQRFTTIAAGSGERCLEIARSKPVDVILLDVMMPGMDGIAVCEELVKDDRTRSIPVILLTGKDDHETRAAGMKLGVSEFLTKPVNKTELYIRVRTQLHSRAQAREMDEALEKVPKE
ncbi:MAG: response regulator [Candidatus Binatia bacterium]